MTSLVAIALLIMMTPDGTGQGQTASRLAAEVREAERAFAKSMADRDHGAFTSFLAEDAVFLSPDRALRGRREVAEGWRPFFDGPTAPFSWEPERVEVTPGGTLAISTGPVRDPDGTRIGTFTSTWRRETDGRWLVVLDSGCPMPAPAATRATDDTRALLGAHETILAAHRTSNVGAWMDVETDTIVVGSRGGIQMVDGAGRRRMREAYLGSTQFSAYRDVGEPVVRVSADGTLGWVIAEVEVKGSRRMPDGATRDIDEAWVWIELYEKQAGRWRMVGNVSTERQRR